MSYGNLIELNFRFCEIDEDNADCPYLDTPSKSRPKEGEEEEPSIIDGLISELSTSKARFLEKEYELEKSEERAKDREKDIFKLQTEIARLQESYVALEQQLITARAREKKKKASNPAGNGKASEQDGERETLSRQLSKAEKALVQERKITSGLRKQLGEKAEAQILVNSLQVENEALKLRLAEQDGILRQEKDAAACLRVEVGEHRERLSRDSGETSAQVEVLKSENETLNARLAQQQERSNLVNRTLDDSKAQCLAASNTIDKLITENVEYIEKVNQQSRLISSVAESKEEEEEKKKKLASGGDGALDSEGSLSFDSEQPKGSPALAGANQAAPISPTMDLESNSHHVDYSPIYLQPEKKKATGFFSFIAGADLVTT